MSSPRPRLKAAFAAVTALGVATALAACGGVDSGSGQSSPPAAGQTSHGPTQGDKLTLTVSAPATGINPMTVNTAFVSYALAAYEPLVYYGPGGKYEPALAAEWEVEPGNTAISLTLRDDANFSDGTPVTAEAVKASLEYCASDQSRNALALADLEEIEVTGEHSLTLRLSQPYPLIMSLVSQQRACGMIVSPKGLEDIENLTVDQPSAGAGRYVYDPAQSISGDTYTYTANPGYYDPSKQYFKSLVIKVIAESQSSLNALVTGQVDVANGDISTAQQAAGEPDIEMVWVPVVWAGLNLIDRQGELTPAMGDVRVRQAINYAIDRAAIAQAILGEFGVPTSSPSAEGYDGYTAEALNYYAYDPDKARQLLAEAGYPDGFELPVATVAWGGLDTLTTAITPMLAAVGIQLQVTTTTDEKAYVEAATDRRHSAVAVGYGSLPMFRMGTDLVLPEARPFKGFGTDDPAALALLAELRVATDDEQLAKAQALNDYLVENAWFAPVLFTPIMYYFRPGITGLDVSGGRSTVSILDLRLAD
ncbi:MAG: ABC transporter substrate-binding protein [Bifidobacteriaceae bacterium]|nr:ABC transporter substrate-binding protein [Bifidobacteriaceae bacterium]